MKSLIQYIRESSIERYQLKVSLKNFLSNFIKGTKGTKLPMTKFKSMLIYSLNKYSDGGPKKDDWLENNLSKEITFTSYIESIGSKERITIEVQDPDYDMMKMCFDKNDVIGQKIYEYIKNNGKKI